MQHRSGSNVTRRRLCAALGTCIALSGCTGDSEKQSGSTIKSIELLNVDETAHQFRVTLWKSGDSQIFERTVSVDGAPGNAYMRTELTDLPATPATKIAIAIEDDSAEKQVSDDLDEPVFTVLCNPDGEIGIARFTDTLEES